MCFLSFIKRLKRPRNAVGRSWTVQFLRSKTEFNANRFHNQMISTYINDIKWRYEKIWKIWKKNVRFDRCGLHEDLTHLCMTFARCHRERCPALACSICQIQSKSKSRFGMKEEGWTLWNTSKCKGRTKTSSRDRQHDMGKHATNALKIVHSRRRSCLQLLLKKQNLAPLYQRYTL
jgi:hypothetical protein